MQITRRIMVDTYDIADDINPRAEVKIAGDIERREIAPVENKPMGIAECWGIVPSDARSGIIDTAHVRIKRSRYIDPCENAALKR